MGRGNKLSKGERTIFVGVKLPESMYRILKNTVSTLRSMGEDDADISKLVRAFIAFRSNNGAQIYREVKNQSKG